MVLAEKYSEAELTEARRLLHIPREQADLTPGWDDPFDSFIDQSYNEEVFSKKMSLHRNDLITSHLPATLAEVEAVSKGANHYLIVMGRSHDIATELSAASGLPVRDVYLPKSTYEQLRPKTKLSELLRKGEDADKSKLYLAQIELADILINIINAERSFAQYAVDYHEGYVTRGNYNDGKRNREHRIVERVRSEVQEPLANQLTSACSYEEIKDFFTGLYTDKVVAFDGASIRLQDGHSKSEIHNACLKFFKAKGFDLHIGMLNYEAWDNFFPYDQEGSDKPVVTMFSPR